MDGVRAWEMISAWRRTGILVEIWLKIYQSLHFVLYFTTHIRPSSWQQHDEQCSLRYLRWNKSSSAPWGCRDIQCVPSRPHAIPHILHILHAFSHAIKRWHAGCCAFCERSEGCGEKITLCVVRAHTYLYCTVYQANVATRISENQVNQRRNNKSVADRLNRL